MKMPLSFVCAVLGGLGLSASLSAQLEPHSEPQALGPLGGSARSIFTDPADPSEIVLIRPSQGLWRSTDAGITFTPHGAGLSAAVTHLYADPADPEGLWALDGLELKHSSDFGATWTTRHTTNVSPFVGGFKQLALSGSGDELLAIDAFNIWRSIDGGDTWANVGSLVPFAGEVYHSVAYSTDGGTAYVGTRLQGVLKSTDGGASFADAGAFSTWTQCLTVSPGDPDTVFAGTFSGLLKSTDGGVTFAPITDPVAAGNSEWFVWEPDGRLWYGTLQTVVHSPDEGATWFDATGGWPVNTPVPYHVGFASDGTRYLGCNGGGLYDQSGGGLYRMAPGTPGDWEHIGFLTALIRDIAVAEPGGLRVVGIGGGVYAGGPGESPTPTVWHADFGADTRTVAVDPSDPTRWVTGGVGAFVDNAQIAVVTGNGAAAVKTYEVFGAGIVMDLDFDPHDPERLVAGVYPGEFGTASIIRSKDGGDSWIDVPGTTGWAAFAVAFDPHTPGLVVQLSSDNSWAASGDSGQTWTTLQPPWPGGGTAVLLEFDPFAPGVIYRGETGSGLWRSDDSAATWTPLGVPLHADSHLLLHPQFPDLMWVADTLGRVLVSTDRGDSFQVALDIPLGSNAGALALDTADGTLLVGSTSASMWELPGGCPVVRLGEGTAGTGGFVPRHHITGLPQLGAPGFGIAGSGFLGGTTVFLAYGLGQTDVPAFGGSFHVDPLVDVLAFPAGGPAGAAGQGAFSIPFTVPVDPLLVGVTITTQCGAVDAGVAHVDGIALSNALAITFHN